MASYRLSPFVSFIESHLHPDPSRYGVFHRLTGEVVEPAPAVLSLLQAMKMGKGVAFNGQDLEAWGEDGRQISRLIDKEFLMPLQHDALSSFVDYYVVRPLQNPAVTFQPETGATILVRISMAERVYSPERGKLPPIFEERISPLATQLLLSADGTKTLRQVLSELQRENNSAVEDKEFRDAIEFLTKPERQLIKFSPTTENLADPFQPANIVPRNFYHSSRWAQHEDAKSIADFHVEGIDDATWEFDIVEPTVNHALRFPSDLLAGLDYGSRFFDAAFSAAIVTARSLENSFDVLEVGGGTGSFARSFIERGRSRNRPLAYHLIDLAPALVTTQRQVLGDLKPGVAHIMQDATEFDLSGQQFDLIIANEVIADFHVAMVERRSDEHFAGEGAVYVEKYALQIDDAPDRFYVNAGVFQFLERAWIHLKPGGAVILSEYGSESAYPAEAFHLNHSEFSIHFGHLTTCARKIGFQCRLQSLKEFLAIDDRQLVLNGREEHIQCLNHVFQKYGLTMPFALFAQREFEASFGDLTARISLDPVRFLPLSTNFYYGADIDQFLVSILTKPAA
jgi:2-polyprenyl-3-methyl-5-hydroxy-6-metoxy-1,4-benzoquinol methylase